MSADLVLQQCHISRSKTPLPIPNQMLSLDHHIQDIDYDKRQLQDFLDHTLSDDYNIHHLSGAMSYAVWSNKVCITKELLHCGLPESPIYVFEAVKVRAKDVLEIFFDNGWDINRPMSQMEPPILTRANLLLSKKLPVE